MKPKKTTDYVESVLRARNNHQSSSSLLALPLGHDELPLETIIQITRLFDFPRAYQKTLNPQALQSLMRVHAQIISGQYRQELRKRTTAYRPECLDLFIQEMGLICALYHTLYQRPDKKVLQNKLYAPMKKLRNSIDAVGRQLEDLRKNDNEWAYIKSLIDNELRIKEKGYENIIPSTHEYFFDSIPAISKALYNITSTKIPVYHGKQSEKRNNALLALAYSFKRCFGIEPTSTVHTNNHDKIYYSDTAILCLNLIYQFHKDSMPSDDTIVDIIKKTIRNYKQRETK